ncbi:MAG: DedA family protein [Thermoanaerobaculia bacterium]
MDLLEEAIDLVLHLDRHLNDWAGSMGPWLYLLLFAIVFCETGLVVTPFLPGDSLLFAVGALAASPGSPIDLLLAGFLLWAAAVAGDAVNYAIGCRLGPKVFTREDSRLLNKQHLLRTQRFYEKHGGKTIVLARFIPIIRTFAPFVAGIGKMRYGRFAVFNVAGGLAWIVLFLLAGYWFGNLPPVKENFSLVVIGIIVVSCIPVAIEYLRARREAARSAGRLP